MIIIVVKGNNCVSLWHRVDFIMIIKTDLISLMKVTKKI